MKNIIILIIIALLAYFIFGQGNTTEESVQVSPSEANNIETVEVEDSSDDLMEVEEDSHDDSLMEKEDDMDDAEEEAVIEKVELATGTYFVNTEISTMNWEGEMLGVKSHEGTINIQEGSFAVDDAGMIEGSVIVDMDSITTTDLEGDSAKGLEDHLKNEDFFNVNEHPTAKFVFTGDSSQVTGDLTIKGITNEITIPVVTTASETETSFAAEFEIDRSAWDVRYGSSSFFDNLEDKVISDEIELSFVLVATK